MATRRLWFVMGGTVGRAARRSHRRYVYGFARGVLGGTARGMVLVDLDHELRSGGDADLGVDLREVRLHGLDADHDFGGDLPVGHAATDQVGDRDLMRGEPVQVIALAACRLQ